MFILFIWSSYLLLFSLLNVLFETWRATVLVTTLFLKNFSSPIILDLHQWQPTAWRRCKFLVEGLCLSKKISIPKCREKRKNQLLHCSVIVQLYTGRIQHQLWHPQFTDIIKSAWKMCRCLPTMEECSSFAKEQAVLVIVMDLSLGTALLCQSIEEGSDSLIRGRTCLSELPTERLLLMFCWNHKWPRWDIWKNRIEDSPGHTN